MARPSGIPGPRPPAFHPGAQPPAISAPSFADSQGSAASRPPGSSPYAASSSSRPLAPATVLGKRSHTGKPISHAMTSAIQINRKITASQSAEASILLPSSFVREAYQCLMPGDVQTLNFVCYHARHIAQELMQSPGDCLEVVPAVMSMLLSHSEPGYTCGISHNEYEGNRPQQQDSPGKPVVLALELHVLA